MWLVHVERVRYGLVMFCHGKISWVLLVRALRQAESYELGVTVKMWAGRVAGSRRT